MQLSQLTSVAAVMLAALTATSGVFAEESASTPVSSTHPLVGKWRFDIRHLNCFEEYDVRADGIRSAVSGEERNESVYFIPPYPDAAGFYRFTDKIVKNNGKPDCFGSFTPVGDIATTYIVFHRDENQFLLCLEPSFDKCVGPFVRTKGDDA